METSMTKLSTATAMELKPTEILRDSGKKAQPGLYAIGRKSGARWVYHSELRQNGKRRGVKVTLGKVPAMDLTTARIEAAKAAQKIEQGINPNEKTIEIGRTLRVS